MQKNVLNILPKKLLRGEREELFEPENTPFIGLFFSSNWCGPCKRFTPILKNFYQIANKTKKQIEIIFCSSDQDKKHFKNYYSTMPWLAIPFGEEIKEIIEEKFSINSIPKFLLFNNKGILIDSDARSIIQKKANNEGEIEEIIVQNIINDWLNPKSDAEILFDILDKKFIRNKKSEIFEINDVECFGVYFSAGWSKPGRKFTEMLISFYNEINKDIRKMEIIFCSFDKSQEEFNDYIEIMPWLVVKYEDNEKCKQLSTIFKINSIPTLLMFNNKGTIIDNDPISIIVSKIDKRTGEYSQENTIKILDFWKNAKSQEEKLLSTLNKEILFKTKRISFNINETKIFGIYFSASSYAPCKKFTKILSDFYKTANKNKKQIEIIFCSSDKTLEDFNEYYSNMSWLSIPFEDNDSKENLDFLFRIKKLPTLLIFNQKGQLIEKDGRSIIKSKWSNEAGYYNKKFAQEIIENWVKKARIY